MLLSVAGRRTVHDLLAENASAVRSGAAGIVVLGLGIAVRLTETFRAGRCIAQFAIVERPSVYCYPESWWTAKRNILTMLLNSDRPREVRYVGPAPDEPGTLVVRATRPLSGPGLKRQIEATLGTPIDARADMTWTEANEVAQILFDAAM